jgi:hypothetical protein
MNRMLRMLLKLIGQSKEQKQKAEEKKRFLLISMNKKVK